MLYVEVPVAPGAAAAIKTFYEEMLLASCTLEPVAGSSSTAEDSCTLQACRIDVGEAAGVEDEGGTGSEHRQAIIYIEVEDSTLLPHYDGHHL
eukprot:SAG31_NODE_2945_length_4874_cov_2.485864_1_plen_93_part_00